MDLRQVYGSADPGPPLVSPAAFERLAAIAANTFVWLIIAKAVLTL